jgi:hypothetical protein
MFRSLGETGMANAGASASAWSPLGHLIENAPYEIRIAIDAARLQ